MKNKSIKRLILPLLIFCSSIIYGQTVKGVVSDASGPLPGVSVVVKGTNAGTETDFDGNYTIKADSGAVLVFRYLGYKTQEVSVAGRSTVNVTLEEDSTQLEEVVVIGYGTTTVKDATGAVSSVTSEDFNKGLIASPEQLIQGKTAGVQIVQSTGEPGGGIAVRIRGTNSVRSNNNPLIVVDGVPLSGGATASGADLGFGSSAPKNPLNFLNPNDIESISILKDASATAIYGSRGANGVIIVTTKTGKGRDGKFELTSTISVSSPANEFDLLNADQYKSALAGYGADVASNDFGYNTNWQDVVTRTSYSHDQNLSYSRSYASGSVRATVGHSKQFGIVENSDLRKTTGRLNLVQRFLEDKLTFNLTSTISNVISNSPAISASAGHRGDLLGAAYSANPTWPADANFTNIGGQINPANILNTVKSFGETDRILANLSTSYKFTDELTGKVTLGYDKSKGDQSTMANADALNAGDGITGNGRGTIISLEDTSELLEATLNYTKEYENSKLEALAGFSYQSFRSQGRWSNGWGFATRDLQGMSDQMMAGLSVVEASLGNGSYQQFGLNQANGLFVQRLFPTVSANESVATPTGIRVKSLTADYWDNENELQSFFARVNYTLYDKFLFTATFRADGSSNFGTDNRYGYFPSAAFAWKLSEEDFIGDNVSTLKLRLNWGITGNQEGLGYGNYLRRERFGSLGIGNGGEINPSGIGPVAFANPELRWEETTSYGLGIDFGFNNDRLNGTFDIYRKETNDLLLNVTAAQPSPQPTFFQNLDAVVVNQGVEFALNYDLVQGEDFNWNVGFNIAYNDNEVQDFNGLIDAGTIYGQGLTGAFAQQLAGGQPLFSYYLREFEGFDANGQPVQRDVQEFVGKSALPTTYGGLSTSASYKNWDFSMYFNGQFGHYIYNNTANAFFTAGSIGNGRNVTQNVIGNGESSTAAADVSTRFLEKGDFIRLQNVSIGYNVPLKERTVFDSMRISLSGQNLFVITDYSGLDPEVSSQPSSGALLNGIPTAGIDYAAYPRPTTFSLGFNVSF